MLTGGWSERPLASQLRLGGTDRERWDTAFVSSTVCVRWGSAVWGSVGTLATADQPGHPPHGGEVGLLRGQQAEAACLDIQLFNPDTENRPVAAEK